MSLSERAGPSPPGTRGLGATRVGAGLQYRCVQAWTPFPHARAPSPTRALRGKVGGHLTSISSPRVDGRGRGSEFADGVRGQQDAVEATAAAALPPPFPLPRLPREGGGLRLRLAGSCQVELRGSSGFGPGWVRRRRGGEGAGARIRGVEFRGVGLAFYTTHNPPTAPPPPGIPPAATPVSAVPESSPPCGCVAEALEAWTGRPRKKAAKHEGAVD